MRSADAVHAGRVETAMHSSPRRPGRYQASGGLAAELHEVPVASDQPGHLPQIARLALRALPSSVPDDAGDHVCDGVADGAG